MCDNKIVHWNFKAVLAANRRDDRIDASLLNEDKHRSPELFAQPVVARSEAGLLVHTYVLEFG